MEQLTAVEWFWMLLPENISKEYYDLFEQAKQMEKEQIINAYRATMDDTVGARFLGEQYYNETYKKQ